MEYARLSEGPEYAVTQALRGSAAGIAVSTSGTTANSRDVLIGTSALRASAAATHAALSGPGCWLIATPTERIAGAMILVRSVIAGSVPVRMPPGTFTPESFARAAETTRGESPTYVSLVPTQLQRLLASPVGRDALASFTAVLVGGGPPLTTQVPPNVISTYGATETSSGFVYDGAVIGQAKIKIADGIVAVAGPILADGYADGDNRTFAVEDGERWFYSRDLGEMVDGRLRVLGRADAVIITGGIKVNPAPVEAALAALDWIAEAVVVGVPDPDWGERVVAVVEAGPGLEVPAWSTMREQLAADLEREWVPRDCILVPSLPRLVNGKADRVAIQRFARQQALSGGLS